MRKYAFVNTDTGEILNIRTPYEVPADWYDGALIDTRLVKELDMSINNSEYMATKVWRNNAWETRPQQPSERHKWTADGWTEVINEGLEWRKIRGHRTHLLLNTDWTQITDNSLTDTEKAEWRTYRQALRDITTNQASVERYEDIVWPTEPT